LQPIEETKEQSHDFVQRERNIDLSIAAVVTLSAYIALLTVRGEDANLAWGVLVALALDSSWAS